MEILNLLENKIDNLLIQIDNLKSENIKLLADLENAKNLYDENEKLKQNIAVDEELRAKTQVKINEIITKINSKLEL